MNHADTSAKLITLANDAGASMEERRTAAFQAAQIMAKHLVVPAHSVPNRFEVEFERTHFLAQMKSEYLHRAHGVYDVLAAEFEHPATECPGRAELNRLVYALAGIAGDVVLSLPNLDKHVAEVRDCLGVVAVAFREWDARQPPADAAQVRAAVMQLFEEPGAPESHLNTIAARLHVPVPAVQAALDELVADGLLRLKSNRYSKVKRRPKPKVTTPDPRQTDMFGGVSP